MQWSHGKKLLRIFTELKAVCNRNPEITVFVREKGVTRFHKATQALFRVVGVSDLLAEMILQDTVIEYSISTIKKAITGNGKADKAEVAACLDKYLTEKLTFETDDESDAVAVGITYFLQEVLQCVK